MLCDSRFACRHIYKTWFSLWSRPMWYWSFHDFKLVLYVSYPYSPISISFDLDPFESEFMLLCFHYILIIPLISYVSLYNSCYCIYSNVCLSAHVYAQVIYVPHCNICSLKLIGFGWVYMFMLQHINESCIFSFEMHPPEFDALLLQDVCVVEHNLFQTIYI